MGRRRTTVQREINNKAPNEITWEDAAELFLDSLKLRGLAYHTGRWNRENLNAVVKQLREC
ncbi:MAG TPA: hypothetical protein VHQ70_05180 [Syntrophomonadaceae bacterium]|nr:hypothetical protein [Syntrophomonadaceae bacterium]